MVAVGRNFRPFYPQEPNRNRNFHRRLRGLDQAMFRETNDAQTHFDRLPDLYLGLKKENYMRACCGSAGRFSSPVIWRSGGHFSLTKPKCSFIVAYNRCCILFHEAVYSATAKMKSVPFGAANPAKDTKGPAAAVFAHRSSMAEPQRAFSLFCCYGIIKRNCQLHPCSDRRRHGCQQLFSGGLTYMQGDSF